MPKTRGYTEATAIKNGMHYSDDKHCPECGCPWYGNKNMCGDGHRTCCDCYQEWWTDINYENPLPRRELKACDKRVEYDLSREELAKSIFYQSCVFSGNCTGGDWSEDYVQQSVEAKNCRFYADHFILASNALNKRIEHKGDGDE